MSGPAIIQWNLCASWDCFFSFIYNWQTLLGGLVAVGAAWYAGVVVRQQIAAAAKLEAERYGRRLRAVRAVLPLTLSGMCDYAEAAAAWLMRGIRGPKLGEWETSAKLGPPAVPEDLITHLASTIESTDDADIIRMLGGVIREVQLLNTRLQGLSSELRNLETRIDLSSSEWTMNRDTYLLQCAVIHAYCSAMFSFARWEEDSVDSELSWDEVFNSFSILGIRRGTYSDLLEFCERTRERGEGPVSFSR